MKITYLLTQSLESPSGLGRYWPLAKELQKIGHQIEIIALHPDYSSLQETSWTEEGVRVNYVAPMHVKKSGSQKEYYGSSDLLKVSIRATKRITQAVFSSNADVYHIGKPHPMNSIAGLFGKWFSRKTIFLDCDDYEAASGNFSSKWQERTIRVFEQHVPRFAKLITCNTKYMIINLKSWGVPEKKIHYLPNGVDRARFNQSIDQDKANSIRKELGIENKQVISYIGSLSLSNHAVDLLIEAFAQVRTENSKSVLLIVGGGEDYAVLKEKSHSLSLENEIIFVGRVEPYLVPIYYTLSTVTIDPVYDNKAARGRSPLKLFESWACGVPFITSNVGDRMQLIGSPPAGIIVEAGNPKALAVGILRVLKDEELRNKVSIIGSSKVDGFYWDKLALNIANIYEKEQFDPS